MNDIRLLSERKVDPEEFSSTSMERVACVILGGGKGTRLFPLTESRCKPAIHFGGNYRLIDVPISNAMNAGCFKISVITQFLSSSIHRHIHQCFKMDRFSGGFVDLLSAEQRPSGNHWFEGTADAVRQNALSLIDIPAEYFLILSGDQLYRMDFKKMLEFAKVTDASLVIATLKVDEEKAPRMGVMKTNDMGEIVDFCEKPSDPVSLERMRNEGGFNASMGIYLFKREVLFDLLQTHPGNDFGKDLIPYLVKKGEAYSYEYNGYWEDIGTIGSFFEANLAFVRGDAPMNLFDEKNAIYRLHSELPGPKISHAKIVDSVLCEGSLIEAEIIEQSIIGPRCVIQSGTSVKRSYLMGNDHYTPPVDDSPNYPPKLLIGEGSVIENAIIDRNVYLGKRVKLVNRAGHVNYDGEKVFVRDGIIVIPQGTYLPDGFEF